MRCSRSFSALLLAVALPFAAAAGDAADATLTARVKAALVADPQAKALAINVDSHDGVVTLRGAVERDDEIAHALDVARGVDGVRDVVNRLSVRNEDKAAKSNQG
jgi:hyperosmotically inducible periplasmic protein